MSGVGLKYDEGKAPVSRGCFSYFPLALQAVAQVSAYGAGKYNTTYEAKNWMFVEAAGERYADAAGRHMLQEEHSMWDEESGLLHAAHAAWSLLAKLELMLEDGMSLSGSAIMPTYRHTEAERGR